MNPITARKLFTYTAGSTKYSDLCIRSGTGQAPLSYLAKYGYGIYVNSNTTINNNTLNKYIYIKGKNNKIMNNIIKTNDIYAIEIISSAINGGNNEITNNTLYSQVFTGDKAVLYSDKSNTIKNNIPVDSNIRVIRSIPSVMHDKNSKFIQILSEVYEKVTGLDGTPVTTTGATYARVMPNIIAFGPSFPGQKGIAHKENEWMDLDDLLLSIKIYMRSLERLGSLE